MEKSIIKIILSYLLLLRHLHLLGEEQRILVSYEAVISLQSSRSIFAEVWLSSVRLDGLVYALLQVLLPFGVIFSYVVTFYDTQGMNRGHLAPLIFQHTDKQQIFINL